MNVENSEKMQAIKKLFSATDTNLLAGIQRVSSITGHQADRVKIFKPELDNCLPSTVLYHPTFISNPEELNKIWLELKRLHSEQTFIANPQLKRSIFNIHSENQVNKCGQIYFPTLLSYITKLKPFFYKRPKPSPSVMALSSLENSNIPTIVPNTIQFNHYQHIEKSSCPLHIDSRGLGPTIGMLSFGNDATMSFLVDPPSNYTIEQVQQCSDEIQVSLPNGSLIILADDIRYKYVHGIRSEIQKRSHPDHTERFSVVFWYQD